MKCRLCNINIETPFLSLGNLPLANSFVKKEDLYKKEEYYPLNVYVCDNCKLVQVEDYVSSDLIFNVEYAYFSSFSKIWVKHCKNYVDMIVKRLNLNSNSRIIEIGSNDGTLLENFKKYGINNILGIDPARDAAHEAMKKGIDTYITMFNDNYVKNNLKSNSVDLIIANNVLAHNPNLNEFVQSMKYVLKCDGVITIEFPHLLNLIKYKQFDTIYHEHFSYFSLISASKLLNQNSLTIFDVEELETHGGSLRLYVKHAEDNTKCITDSVYDMLYNETEFGIDKISTYHNFADKVIQTKKDILYFMLKLSFPQIMTSKRKVVGYGAPAKGNTLLNYCGIGKEFIEYTVDLNPHKQGKYLPGNRILIYNPDKIKEDKPDYIIILPWNIVNEIVKQLEYTREWSCKLITLIPNILIIE